MSMSTEI